MINSKKWDSIQELRSYNLKIAPAEIFTVYDGVQRVLDFLKVFDYRCGLRTDHPDAQYLYPFYLPSAGEQILKENYIREIERIWEKDSSFYIIPTFSPNLVEGQLWDAVVWVTEYRHLIGEITLEVCNSLRFAWSKLQLRTIENIYDYKSMPKVRGDLIKKKIYNRRVEVSLFPKLGLYYWQIGDYDNNIGVNPPKNWNIQKKKYFHVVRNFSECYCGKHRSYGELYYNESADEFFLCDSSTYDFVHKALVCPNCTHTMKCEKQNV